MRPETLVEAMRRPMNKSTHANRKFANLLITHEEHEHLPITSGSRSFSVSDKLHPYLATLMGPGGYHALLSRALVLAAAEIPWLCSVEVKPDGSLEGLDKIHESIGQAEFLRGRVVLLAQLLGLLNAFIGELLTLRLLREAWPRVPLNDLNFGNGDKHAKKK
jgi:hypothetical protein